MDEKPGYLQRHSAWAEIVFTVGASVIWVALLTLGLLALAGKLGAPVGGILPFCGPSLPFLLPTAVAAQPAVQNVWSVLVSGVIFAPIIEELFRTALLRIASNDDGTVKNPWLVVAGSGVLFGWLHGSFLNVFLQGVIGMLLARLWFRSYQRSFVVWTAYLSCVLAHALYNLIVFMI